MLPLSSDRFERFTPAQRRQKRTMRRGECFASPLSGVARDERMRVAHVPCPMQLYELAHV